MRRKLVGIFCLVLMASGSGCGGPTNRPLSKDDMATNALNDVGELYRVFTAQKKRPPTKTADFVPMEPMNPTGVHAIEIGDVIVRWGAVMTDLDQEGPSRAPGDEVLAYLKEVPSSGGPVLMLNRSIRTMTADEFQAAPKAGTTDSSTGLKPRKKAR